LPSAELFATSQARWVFRLTNGALELAQWLQPGRPLPSLRHSLAQRHHMFDRLFQEWDGQQVLELAAGLSRRGAWASADPSCYYLELDLPHVLATKESLLGRSAAGRRVLARANLQRVAADLSVELPSPGIDRDRPLLILAEGLLMYLDADQQASLWRRVHRLLSEGAGGRFIFDLVPSIEQPRPSMVGEALGRAMKHFTGGRGFAADERSRSDILAGLQHAGFTSVKLHEPSTTPPRWNLPHLDRPTQALLFDGTVGP